jgi:trimethylamine---corrinoid protein Co-methyltransferase
MIESNKTSIDSTIYRRLSDTQLQDLHEATLEILERTGIRILDERAVEIFKKGGCEVVDGNRVHIPSWRVEWALNLTPKQIMLYDQTGEPAIRLGGKRTFFGPGSDLLRIIDHRDDVYRHATFKDVQEFVRLVDALPNHDFVMSGFIPMDVPTHKVEVLQMQAMLENTNKPIVFVTTGMENTIRDTQMAEIYAGGADNFRRKPFAACYINITHPLKHNADSLQKLMYLSEKRIPFVYRPSISTRGLTGPVTQAGFLVCNNASTLAGVVLAQLTCQGAPFIRCCCPGGTFDMRTMVGHHTGAEIRGFNEELAHFYNMPCFGIGGSTSSKVVDQQAALEATLNLITGVLAGSGLMHDVGYMAASTTGSFIQSAICDEIIAWVGNYMKGLDINREQLGLDVIHELGSRPLDDPAFGKFIDTDHTLAHFKEDYYPDLIDQQVYDNWFADGGTTLKERAKVKVEEILATHQPPSVDSDICSKLQEVVDKTET